MQKNYINFKKERDLGSIITDTFKFIKEEYRTLFRLYIKHVGWLLLLVIAASTYYQYQSLKISTNVLTETGPAAFLTEMIADTGVAILLLSMASIAYSALSLVVITSIIKSYVQNNGEINEDEVNQFVKQFFGRTLGSLVVVGLLVFIGFLLFVLPGIYLIVPLALIFPILVFQEKTFAEAFSESFKLIKNNWWISFSTLLVVSILISLIGGLFQLPIVVMTAMETFVSIQDGTGTPGTETLSGNWLYMLFYILAALAQYLLGIVTLISLTLVYFNLNEFHNKTGTLEDIDRIGK